MRFNQIAVPADLFANEERSFIESIIELQLCVAVRPDENGVDDIQALDWLRIYERSVSNIVNLLNRNNLLNLTALSLKLSIHLDDFNHDEFVYGIARTFEGAIYWTNVRLFTQLRRGRMSSNWRYTNARPSEYEFSLTFNFH